MIFELENIISKLDNRYGIGKGSKSKDVRYYEETLKRFKSMTDYDYESEYINACKQIKRFTPYNKELSGYDDISIEIQAAQKKCKEIAKKKEEEYKKKKEQSKKEKENENELRSMKKQLENAQKKAQKNTQVKEIPPQIQ